MAHHVPPPQVHPLQAFDALQHGLQAHQSRAPARHIDLGVVTGDDTQIDVAGGRSGLVGLETVLQGIEGLEWVHLGRRDVVRHRIVQDIVSAYESASANARPDGQQSGGPVATGRG